MANLLTELLCAVGIAAMCEGGQPADVGPPPGKIDDSFYSVPAAPAPEPVAKPIGFDAPSALALPPIETGTGTRVARLPVINTGEADIGALGVTLAGPGCVPGPGRLPRPARRPNMRPAGCFRAGCGGSVFGRGPDFGGRHGAPRRRHGGSRGARGPTV